MATVRRPAPTLTGKTIAHAMAAKPAIVIANAPSTPTASAKSPIASMPTAASQISVAQPQSMPMTSMSKAPSQNVTAQSLPKAPTTDARRFALGQAPKGMSSLPTGNVAPREFQKIMGVAPSAVPVAPPAAVLPPPDNPVSGGFIPPATPDTSGGSSGGSGGGDSSGSGSSGSGDSSSQSDQTQSQDDGSGGQYADDGSGQQYVADDGSGQQYVADDGSGAVQVDDGSSQTTDDGSVTPDDAGDGADVEGFGAEKFPRFSAYLQGDKLCAFGLVKTEWGIAPLVTVVTLPGQVTRNGPPQFGADPDIDSAMQETKGRLVKGADMESIRLCAESLVRRANQGDQNARALINRIGKNAAGGNERAIHAKASIEQYCALHPNDPNQPTMFGVDAPRKTYHRGAVRLANGPQITSHRVRELASTFGGKHARHRKIILKAAHSFGEERDNANAAQGLDQNERGLHELGQCVGMALGIQCVRAGGPISKLSKQAAWELGAK